MVQLSYPYMAIGKPLDYTDLVGKVMSLLFNMLSRLVIVFLPKSKYLLISWLQSSSAVILEPKKIKSLTAFPSTCHEVMGPDAMLSFKPVFFFFFHSLLSLLPKGSLVPLHFLPQVWYQLHI